MTEVIFGCDEISEEYIWFKADSSRVLRWSWDIPVGKCARRCKFKFADITTTRPHVKRLASFPNTATMLEAYTPVPRPRSRKAHVGLSAREYTKVRCLLRV